MVKKILSAFGSVALLGALTVAPSFTNAASAACNPVKPVGKTVGTITAGSVSMPIKSFDYPAGGIMEPPKSTMMAGLSDRHMPLSSTLGTSVIVWHVNYAGCNNELNILTEQKNGFVFKIKGDDGKVISYKITKKYVVTKGDYQENWFNLIGPRQLLLVTCSGPFKNGHYTENTVLIAKPV